jgi:hypothetical protein
MYSLFIFQYCIRQGQILAEVKNIRQFYAIKHYLAKEHPDGLIRYQVTFCQARITMVDLKNLGQNFPLFCF